VAGAAYLAAHSQQLAAFLAPSQPALLVGACLANSKINRYLEQQEEPLELHQLLPPLAARLQALDLVQPVAAVDFLVLSQPDLVLQHPPLDLVEVLASRNKLVAFLANNKQRSRLVRLRRSHRLAVACLDLQIRVLQGLVHRRLTLVSEGSGRLNNNHNNNNRLGSLEQIKIRSVISFYIPEGFNMNISHQLLIT
jgi:hypothetical protein